LDNAPPLHLVLTFLGAAAIGIVTGTDPLRRRWWPTLLLATATLGLAVMAGAAANHGHLTGWRDPQSTGSRVSMLAIIVFAVCGLTAVQAFPHRSRRGETTAALLTIAICIGWLGYVIGPSVLAGGPPWWLAAGGVTVLIGAYGARHRRSRDRNGSEAQAFSDLWRGELSELAHLLIDRPELADRIASHALIRTYRSQRYLTDIDAIRQRARQHLIRMALRHRVPANPRNRADPQWLALRRLPPIDQAAWILAERYELDIEEIAIILRIGRRSAARIVARAQAATNVAPLTSLLRDGT
jgi:hypothetical protein